MGSFDRGGPLRVADAQSGEAVLDPTLSTRTRTTKQAQVVGSILLGQAHLPFAEVAAALKKWGVSQLECTESLVVYVLLF
jgi:hypothetical protein